MLKKATTPKNTTELKRFLGLLQYYREMLPHISHACHRLYAATSTTKPFKWTSQMEADYFACKDMLEKEIMQNSLEGDDDVKTYHDASRFAVCTILRLREVN